MTIFEFALFIAILVFVILFVATILNNPSEFYTKTPWFEITLYVKSRASKLNDWLLPPPGATRFRLPNHNNLISFKYHCFMNTIAVIVSVFTCVLTLMIFSELKQISLIKLIHEIIWGLPTYWFFSLFSIPCIFLLIKKLEVSWVRALFIIHIVLFVNGRFNESLWEYKIITEDITLIVVFFGIQILLLSLCSWINYKLQWD